MSHDPPHLDEFLAFKELFEDAEDQIKRVERRIRNLVMPGVNELRYAGNHLLRAVAAPPGSERDLEFERARGHCERAIYDATEGGLLYCLDEVRIFQRDYRLFVIPSVVPNYLDLIGRVRAARQLVEETDDEGKAAASRKCADLFVEVADIVQVFDDARPELNKKRRNAAMTAAGVVLGLILSAMALLDGSEPAAVAAPPPSLGAVETPDTAVTPPGDD